MADAADDLEYLIQEIHTKLEALRAVEAGSPPAAIPTPIPYGFGNLKRNENAAPPRVIWIEQGGRCDSGRLKGIEAETIGIDICRLQIGIWATSKAEARKIWRRLRAASHRVTFGPNANWVGWEFPTELEGKWLENGRELLLATVELNLPVPRHVPGEIEEVTPEGHRLKVELENPADDTDIETVFSNWP